MAFCRPEVLLLITLFVWHCHSVAKAAPIDERFKDYLRSTDYKTDNMCEKDSNHSDMCERCAKLSRNQYVYPLCCANDQQVGDWCLKYINYTID